MVIYTTGLAIVSLRVETGDKSIWHSQYSSCSRPEVQDSVTEGVQDFFKCDSILEGKRCNHSLTRGTVHQRLKTAVAYKTE